MLQNYNYPTGQATREYFAKLGIEIEPLEQSCNPKFDLAALDYSAIERRILAKSYVQLGWLFRAWFCPPSLQLCAVYEMAVYGQQLSFWRTIQAWRTARQIQRKNKCSIPPAGWYCSRAAGHGGPCAARRKSLWQRIVDRIKRLVR